MLQTENKNILKLRKSLGSIYRMIYLNNNSTQDIVKEQQIDQIRKKLKKLCNTQKETIINNKENLENTDHKNDHHMTYFLQRLKSPTKDYFPIIKQSTINRQTSRKEVGSIQCQSQPSIHRIKKQLEQLLAEKNKKNKLKKEKSLANQDKSSNNCFSILGNHDNKPNLLQIQSQKINHSPKKDIKLIMNEQIKSFRKKLEYNSRQQSPKSVEGHKLQIARESPSILSSKKSLLFSKYLSPLKTSEVFSQIEKKSQILNKTLIESPKQKYQAKNESSMKKQVQLTFEVSKKLRNFAQFIGFNNGVFISKRQNYKFYVGKGNNEELPRRLLKRRKWIETSNISEANFVWTQKKNCELMEELKSVPVTQKQNLDNEKNKIEFSFSKQNKLFQKLLFPFESQDQKRYKICEETNKTKVIFDVTKIKESKNDEEHKFRMHNHLCNHHEIAYKKLLFTNLKEYYESQNVNPFNFIPLTFHIQSLESDEWQKFSSTFNQAEVGKKNLWIIKPGQNTNRGNGIQVEQDFEQIKKITQEMIGQNKKQISTVIVQQYIMPFLYNKRKFDIRSYALVTVVANDFKVYWYEEGYIRTSCKVFTLSNIKSKYIHLTNDAVQKNSNEYGKFEPGNKISFEVLAKYIEKNVENSNFNNDIYPQMVKLAADVFKSTYNKLHQQGKDFCFEVFGFDFMIDEQLKVWLIEVNRNPCLQTQTFLLDRIICGMLQNAFKIAVDPIFPISEQIQKGLEKKQSDVFQNNKFQIILSKTLTGQSKGRFQNNPMRETNEQKSENQKKERQMMKQENGDSL